MTAKYRFLVPATTGGGGGPGGTTYTFPFPPTVNDDNTSGYVNGDVWIDTSADPDQYYKLTDNTTGAAVWQIFSSYDELQVHIADNTNPHNVTATQVGASPVGHVHTAADITDFDVEVGNHPNVTANTLARHTHANKAELDLITDGDHDIRTDNPHNVTTAQIGAAEAVHTHPHSDLTGIGPDDHHAHPNKAELDLISDGDHDVRTDNPHNVTTTQIGAAEAVHTHPHSDLTGIGPDDHHAHPNKAELDLISDGDHDVRTDNPHGVTIGQIGAAAAVHTHVAADITDFDTEVSNNIDVAANTAARHTHANKAELDLISDGDHDVRTDNPHGVTAAQTGSGPLATTPPVNVDSSAASVGVSTQVARADHKHDIAIFAGATTEGLVPDPLSTTGKFLKDDGTWATIAGGGDMLASTYDPTGVGGDAFDADNHAYNNATSGLVATNTQAAIDEIDGRIDSLETDSHTHANKAELDLITDGDHDVRTDNPHGVTAIQVGAAPAVHTHVAADVTDFDTEVSNNVDVAANTAARHTHANKAELDLITDGDHDVRTDNPHGVTAVQVGAAPTVHTHTASQITDFDTEVSNNPSVAANTAKVTNATHTGDVTGDQALTIAPNAVDNIKAADMPSNSVKVRAEATAGDPQDIVVPQNTVLGRLTGNIQNITGGSLTSILDIFTDLLKGLVPPSGGGTDNFLRADGTWAVPPSAGAGAFVNISTTTLSTPQSHTGDSLWTPMAGGSSGLLALQAGKNYRIMLAAEIRTSNSNQSAQIRIWDVTGGVAIAAAQTKSIEVGLWRTVLDVQAPGAGNREYRLEFRIGNASATVTVSRAHLIVDEEG